MHEQTASREQQIADEAIYLRHDKLKNGLLQFTDATNAHTLNAA
jgi:hypothetical protein